MVGQECGEEGGAQVMQEPDVSVDQGSIRKGSIIKLFGVVLILIGGMDSMLSWRGGFPVGNFYVGLIAAGIVIYALGAIRGQKR